MRLSVLGLVSLLLAGCASVQKVAENARDNAKPASAPMLMQYPISSAIWPQEPGTLYVTRSHFTLAAMASLFNKISVAYGGNEAVELARGQMPFRPIDKAGLAPGKVYFRLTSAGSDANQQTQGWIIEIVDRVGVLKDFPTSPVSAPLTVRETSINPRYAGTPDEQKESSLTVLMDPRFINPLGQGGVSQCRFRFTTSILLPKVEPGARATYPMTFEGCRGAVVYGHHRGTGQVDLRFPSYARVDQSVSLTISTSAHLNEVVTVLGYDQLWRPAYFLFNQKVNSPVPAPTLPCDANNGFQGQRNEFKYCAACDGDARVPLSSPGCTEAEARTAAEDALEKGELKGCTLSNGLCTACPSGQAAQSFPFCMMVEDNNFGYTDFRDGIAQACSQEDVDTTFDRDFAGYERENALGKTFHTCHQCTGVARTRSLVTACTESQAIKITEASLKRAGKTGCTVQTCP